MKISLKSVTPSRIALTLFLTLLPLSFTTLAREWQTPFNPPVCIEEAKKLCDEMPLMDPEGIWEFPDYNVTTVIIRENDRCNTFGIWVVDSENCAVSPGSRLGTLSTSLQSGKYALKIFSSFKKGQLSAPREALATLSVKDEAIFIDKLKIDFTINPLAMIPSFARRMFRLKFNDPIRQIKKGLTKIYPSYDGNGSSRRQPVYL